MESSITFSITAIVLAAFIQFGIQPRLHVLTRKLMASAILTCPLLFHAFTNGDFNKIGINFSNPGLTLLISLFFSTVAIWVNYHFAWNPENIKLYPQVRTRIWTIRLVILNILSWCVYILIYEFVFRGYLFFESIDHYGFTLAIFFNVIIYSVAHIPKSLREAILSMPLAVLLCLITWYTGNIWSSVFIHLTLALSNEYFAFRANPNLSFQRTF